MCVCVYLCVYAMLLKNERYSSLIKRLVKNNHHRVESFIAGIYLGVKEEKRQIEYIRCCLFSLGLEESRNKKQTIYTQLAELQRFIVLSKGTTNSFEQEGISAQNNHLA